MVYFFQVILLICLQSFGLANNILLICLRVFHFSQNWLDSTDTSLPPVDSLCLCLVEKKEESHFESLSSCLPISPSHFSDSPVYLSVGITLCSPFILAENISMWSWTHLSVPEGCLSNCHSPLPHLLHSRLNTKKRTTNISMTTDISITGTHTQYTCLYRHLNTFHFPIITPSIFTLAPTHSPCITTFANHGHSHMSILWWEKTRESRMLLSTFRLTSGFNLCQIGFTCTHKRWMHKQNRHLHMYRHTCSHTNTHTDTS